MKLRCLLGWHKWEYFLFKDSHEIRGRSRKCTLCSRQQDWQLSGATDMGFWKTMHDESNEKKWTIIKV